MCVVLLGFEQVRDVASVVGFLGATMGTLMMMVIPGLLVYKMEIFSSRWSHLVKLLLLAFLQKRSVGIFPIFEADSSSFSLFAVRRPMDLPSFTDFRSG